MNATEECRAAMRIASLGYYGPVQADGELHRFKAVGDHARNSWYVLHPDPPAAGMFGCWKRGIKESWCERNGQLSQSDWSAVRKRWRVADKLRKRAELERHEKARKVAGWIFERAKPLAFHSYLERKGVRALGNVREYRGTIVLPLSDSEGRLRSLQFIGADGTKRFLTGGRIAGCFFTAADKTDGAMVICEGYATGASIFEATGFAIVCAMNCGNLLAVSKALREKWPNREIILAADDDQWTVGNPGMTKGVEAAKSIRARLATPQFEDATTKPTDFNDLHKLEGVENVKTQMQKAMIPKQSSTPAQWFANKYPSLSDEHGVPVWEETNKEGIVKAKDIGEDFFAATLGSKGSPDAPTVFLPTEEKFYTYLPEEGVFSYQREPVLLARLSQLLLKCARECQESCDTKALEFRFRNSANLTGALRKARGLLEVPHDYFASELTKFIPCANGMLRLDDKILLPFTPSYKRRNKLAVRFDPAAKCPLFLDTLMRTALEHDDLDLLQRWCGQALIGENLAQKILILTGTAGGGKGTFIRVLTGVIGQINLASLRTPLLGERFEQARFLGKTLLYGADVPENFLNQRGASVLKSLTGYDPLTVEFKNSNESPAIDCKFNVIVTCNSRLVVHLEGDTEAWRRRVVIIEYQKPKPQKVIADLDKQILANEASGVLNWMLDGLDKLRADGWQLKINGRQQRKVDNLLLESESYAVFARECLASDATCQATVPECFATYVEFCNQHGWNALTKNKFGTLMDDVVVRLYGLTVRHDIPDATGKLQRGWRGIKISQPSGKIVSEVSDKRFSDNSDASLQVEPGNMISDREEAMLL